MLVRFLSPGLLQVLFHLDSQYIAPARPLSATTRPNLCLLLLSPALLRPTTLNFVRHPTLDSELNLGLRQVGRTLGVLLNRRQVDHIALQTRGVTLAGWRLPACPLRCAVRWTLPGPAIFSAELPALPTRNLIGPHHLS
jgi:hypothetical protein